MSTDSDEFFLREFRRLIEPVVAAPPLYATSVKGAIEQRLKELNLTLNKVIDLLGVDFRSIDSVMKGTAKRVDILTAIKLSQFLGIKIEEFIKLYTEQMDTEQIGEIDRARRATFITSSFDLQQLKTAGFFKAKSSVEDMEGRINKYFGFDHITEYEKIDAGAAFSRIKKDPHTVMREFWVKSAYVHFTKLNNPNPFNRKELVELLPKFRPYTMDVENGLLTVVRALYRIGVTVIFQSTLVNANVRGATFCVNGKPCIVLTDYQKRYTTIWHTLIHELHHALYDLETIEKTGYHLTGEPDLFLINENQADSFARNYLFSETRSKQIAPFISNEVVTKKFADAAQVHPSFVYAYHLADLYAKGDDKAWASKLATKIPKSDLALFPLNTHVFSRDTIQESVDELVQKVFNF